CDHLRAGLARAKPPRPRIDRALELAERRGNRSGRLLAELMTADAAEVLHRSEVSVEAAGHGFELRGRRQPHHRVPVSGRVRLGCNGGIRGRYRRERDTLAGAGGDPLRVDETVAAHPYAIGGRG